MAYLALARKYRPQTFGDILGQESIVRTLRNSLEQNRIHQAYLLSGVRGVGKTTTARILAKALNCAKGPTSDPCNECTICREITEGIDLDVREIDAATYTQVDHIRELREVTQFQPVRDRKRIFIIDEAHMLSTPAWNALLKLIEEPPPHVVFIMATTEMQKVPATILSRVQRLVFRKITPADVAERLGEICRNEEIEAEPEALQIIARRGEGSVRDSLSLLDQIVAFSGRAITAADVATILGLSDSRFFARVVGQIHEGNPGALLDTLEEAAESGRDFKLLYRDLLAYLRNLLILASGASDSLVSLHAEEIETLKQAVQPFDYSELLRILNLLMKDDELISRTEQQRLAVEIAILKAATFPRLRQIEHVLAAEAGPAEMKPVLNPKVFSVPKTSTTRSPGKSDLRQEIIEGVRKKRKATASYLEQASRIQDDEGSVSFEFAPRDGFAAEYLSTPEHQTLVEQVATELKGRPTHVRFLMEEDKPAASTDASTVAEDPIVKAFAKHLGGEVVPPKGTKRSSEAP